MPAETAGCLQTVPLGLAADFGCRLKSHRLVLTQEGTPQPSGAGGNVAFCQRMCLEE